MDNSAPPIIQPPDAPRKSGIPVFAWVLLAVAALAVPCLAAVLFPVFNQARLAAKRTQSLQNIKSLALAQIVYASDHDDYFCPATNWEIHLTKHISPDLLLDHTVDRGTPLGFGMNVEAGSKNLAWLNDPASTVMMFSSNIGGPSAVGGAEDLRFNAGRSLIAFTDGSARTVFQGSGPLIWKIEVPKE